MKNKNIYILGGNGLIGKSIYKKFLNLKKSNIIILDIKINKKKKHEIFFDANKTNSDKKLFQIFKKKGDPSIFINASYPKNKNWNKLSFSNIKKEDFKENIFLHFNSFLWLSRCTAEYMKRKKIFGNIILLSSIYGTQAQDLQIYKNTKIKENMIYPAIKGGINNFVRQVASYYGKYNIRCNAVSPGGVLNKEEKNKKMSKNFIRNYLSKNPIKRLCKPSDVANTVNFLALDEADYITGQVIHVDGGFTVV